ncbi:putative exocyst complex component Exo70, cullin repeat-like-containing domain superfamily [Helianthus anomalus]
MKEFELRSDVYVDLVYADAIKEMKGVADRMIRSGYEKECCQVYCNIWRDVLDECLSILGVEKVSVEEMQRIECKVLDEKIRNGFRWLKFFSLGKKKLCVQVLNESELIKIVWSSAGERVGRGGKILDHVFVGKSTHKGLKTFF